MVIRIQHFPFDAANAIGKAIGIITWHRCHRQNVARQAIEYHHGTGFQPKPARGIIVQVDIDGQLNGFSRYVWPGGQIADDLAACGDFGALCAGFALQAVLKRLFEAVLADLETGSDQQRVFVLLIFFGRHRAYITDKMADSRTAWVKARITLPWADPGKVGQAHADGGEAFIIQPVGNLNRLKALGQFQLAMNAVHIVGR